MSIPDERVQVILDGRLVMMPRAMAEQVGKTVKLTIDGRPAEVPRVSVSDDPKQAPVPRLTSIYDAALKAGVEIPTLCHREYMNPVAVCRVCCVEVEAAGGRRERVMAPACYRPVDDGIKVSTHHTSERVRSAVKTVIELLMTDHPAPCAKHREYGDCELEVQAERFGLKASRFARSAKSRPRDESSLVIAVDHSACILCDRCIRGCNDIRDNQVIGRMGKGYRAAIAFDLNTPMGVSSCVDCGECMVSCPTGALTFRSPVGAKPWERATPVPEPVSAEELAGHPVFEGVSHAFLRWNEGTVVRRRYRKGDTICREGAYGSTAFYIEAGSVEVSIQAPLKHLKSLKNPAKDQVNRGLFGLVRRFTSALVDRDEDCRDEESTSRYIAIDAPVALRFDRSGQTPVAALGSGDIFGEMTCLNNYPRSATVRAKEDCTVLEMLHNVLYILQRSKKSRSLLEAMYRHRAIDDHLRSVDIFASVLKDDDEFARFANYLRDRVQLIRLNPGDMIIRQGDAADSFYLVRIGFVKVSQRRPGGDHVIAYLGPGKYFGEIGLMAHIPEVRNLAPPGVCTATCTALDHVDVVRISGDDFRTILDRFPRVSEEILQEAVRRLRDNEQVRRQVENVPLGNFLRQGLFEAQSLLVLDLERCTRCDECTKACADAHDGVTRLVREGLRFDRFLVASSCRSCLDPYCMVGCPVGSIRRRNSREIIIEDWCIGCGKCAENCPYGNINMHPFPAYRTHPDTGRRIRLYEDDPQTGRRTPVVQHKATTCDLCTDLRDQQPSCVYACPHDAAFRMTGQELLEQVRRQPS
jgi:CRP-like cAMP-binding protein/Fe-S-cluster-containing hydrogenase component 2